MTLVERDSIGGAAHLWDCIPSKAMIATGNARLFLHRSMRIGLEEVRSDVDLARPQSRLDSIRVRLEGSIRVLLESRGVRIVDGVGSFKGPHEVVEFGHLFQSMGSEVTLVVSRQQVLPQKDPEVAAALESDFLRRGVRLFKGARATVVERNGDEVTVRCDDGRVAVGSHALLAIGSVPNSEMLNLEAAGVVGDRGYVPVDMHLRSNVEHIYAAGDISGRLPLSSVASMQGRKIAEHALGFRADPGRRLMDYDKAASAIFTGPEIADVGLAEADAFSSGRKIRVTKAPFASAAKALINDDSRGFVKIISDPATRVVLGGSVVGRHAAE